MLGDHVKQAGSLVAPDRLRFDFSHYEPVTAEQIERDRAHRQHARRWPTPPVRAFETTKDEAEQLGAIAFFGDKYGDIVRVLEAGPSIELCGGTHVRATGDIGTIKVVSEGSIGSNLRRIEAVTGEASVALLQRDERVLAEAAKLVGTTGDDLVGGVQRKLDELRAARRRAQGAARQAGHRPGRRARRRRRPAASSSQRVDGLDTGDLRDLAIAVRNEPGVDDRRPRRRHVGRRRGPRRRRASRRPASRRRASSRTPPRPSAVAAAARATWRRPAGATRLGIDEALRIAADAAAGARG